MARSDRFAERKMVARKDFTQRISTKCGAFRAKTFASGPFQRVLTVYFPRAAAATPFRSVQVACVKRAQRSEKLGLQERSCVEHDQQPQEPRFVENRHGTAAVGHIR